MTGTYVDVPGRRMAWDRDGSVGFFATYLGASPVALTGAQAADLNSEGNFSIDDDGIVGVIFPELRDMAGFFVRLVHSSGERIIVEASADTTNGVDGTWTTVASGGTFNTPGSDVNIDLRDYAVSPYYRTVIYPLTTTAVRGIRFRRNGNTSRAGTVHLYGSPSSTPTTGLAIWHPTSNAEVTGPYFDWGDVAQSTTATRTFRVKNRSSLQANGVTVSMEALTPGSPSIVSSHTFSLDGSTYASSISVGTLAAGAISGTLYVKRTNPSNDQLSLRAGRIVAVASSFS